jgi:hypothetical protein
MHITESINYRFKNGADHSALESELEPVDS